VLLGRGSTLAIAPEVATAIGSRKHIVHDGLLFLPLFGTAATKTHAGGMPTELVGRIKVLEYKQFFYLPRFSDPKTAIRTLEESVARFDRVFFVHPHHNSVDPVDIRLSDEAMSLLKPLFSEFLGLPTHPDAIAHINLLKELLLETLPS
jgi:hypothetical protein